MFPMSTSWRFYELRIVGEFSSSNLVEDFDWPRAKTRLSC